MSIKKLLVMLSFFLVMGIAFTTMNANAHKPMHLDFNYDSDADTLKVTVIHGVTDPTFHYVSFIEITVNHSTVHTQAYTSQPTTNIFTYEYTGIAAGFNATVEVIATCNIEGVYSDHFNVDWGVFEHKGSFSSVVAPTVISTLLVAFIVLLPKISQMVKRRK
ncbi:MAG: hypothetical protein ACW972_04050 [Promethearchaeota archaeon]|jgi:desulfoferrodoxin (superoxide reductase-like protein)